MNPPCPRVSAVRSTFWVCVTCALVLACSSPRRHPHRETPRVDPVVARVDGEAITSDEIRDIALGAGISPREALDRAVDTHLLAREARRRRMLSPVALADVIWHAAVQELLQRDVVEGVTLANLPADKISDALSARRVELSPGDLVRAVHFVALVRPNAGPAAHRAARRVAEAFRARLVATAGERPTLRDFDNVAAQMSGPGARAELLAPFDRDGYTATGRYVENFAAVAFALTDAEPLSPVFETIYGEHVALWLGEIPAAPRPPAEVLAIVQRDVLVRERAETLQQELQRLRARYGATVSEDVLAAIDPPRTAPSGAP